VDATSPIDSACCSIGATVVYYGHDELAVRPVVVCPLDLTQTGGGKPQCDAWVGHAPASVVVGGDERVSGLRGDDRRMEAVATLAATLGAIPDHDLHGLRAAVQLAR
jgi:hypothetical protein